MKDITSITQEYFTLKEEVKRIEARLADLRPTLEMHIKASTGSLTGESNAGITVQVGDYGINLSPAKRESFATKLAVEKLGEDLLKPFISTTWFTVLKVTRVIKQTKVA